MNDDHITVHIIRWDDDILRDVRGRINGASENGSATYKAHYGKAVSRLTGIFASMLFYEEKTPESLISHHADGKPYMEGFPDITVSISHCGIISAVSISPVCHGIDIERKREIRTGILRRVFSEREQNVYTSIMSADEQIEFFFRCWTRKEAMIKTGVLKLGSMYTVSADLPAISLGGHDYFFDTVVYDDRHLLSVCCQDNFRRIQIKEHGREAQLSVSQLVGHFLY